MSRRFNVISAVLAFFLWSSWAFYVNQSGSPWMSSLTQGAGSFIITLIMVRAVTFLYHRLSGFPVGLLLLVPPLMVVSVTGTGLASAHALVGTPQIMRTILPALSVALAFNIFTVPQLVRLSRKEQEVANV